MQNGTTYIVRPFMEPANFSLSFAFISAGSAQLLVGPASVARRVQMNVRSSTRATSDGVERARKELGRFSGFSRVKTPRSTSSCVSRFHSASDPSHHSIESGWQRDRTSSIQASRRGWAMGELAAAVAVIDIGMQSDATAAVLQL